MSGRVVVTGAGVVSALGATPGELHAALCGGRTAVAPRTPFAVDGREDGWSAGIPGFDPRADLGNANFRPLDRTGQLATVAAHRALEAAGWSAEARAGAEVGLVLGTMFGSVRTISEFDRRALVAGPAYVKPLDFANSVINAAAGQTAIWHDLRGVNTTLAGGPGAGLQAIAYAADLIAGGRAEALLAGGADELCPESFLGFARAGRLAAAGAGGRPVPFEARRDGCALGEGAALLMLEAAGSAARRGATVLAEVRGHGGAFDPSRGGDAAGSARALTRAVRQALATAGTGPDGVACVSSGASGRPVGDHGEARGLAEALDGAAATVPVTAVKSMLGEALGASGGLQAVALLEALRRGELPGIAGLEQVEAGLPLGGLAATVRPVGAGAGIATSVDFDGNAHCLLLWSGEGG